PRAHDGSAKAFAIRSILSIANDDSGTEQRARGWRVAGARRRRSARTDGSAQRASTCGLPPARTRGGARDRPGALMPEKPAELMDSTMRLLSELVAIDSVTPTLVPGAAGEGAVADAIAAEMRRAGLDVVVQDAAPGRPNVVGVLEGRAKGRTLM